MNSPERVTVDAQALLDLIEYANAVRRQRDGEFCTSWEEHGESDREFEALVNALGQRGAGS